MLGPLDFLWSCAEDREAMADSVLRMIAEDYADKARAVPATHPDVGTLMQMAEMETIFRPSASIKEEAKFVFLRRWICGGEEKDDVEGEEGGEGEDWDGMG